MRGLLLVLAPAWVFGSAALPGVAEWATEEAIPHSPAPPLAHSAGMAADTPRGRVDWPTFAGDPGSLKYSPLADIDRANVAGLVPLWSWSTGEKTVPASRAPVPGQEVRPGAFEATPIAVRDTLYLSTPFNRVVALDAATGAELWSYDPRAYDWGRPPNGTGLVHRGVALWSDGTERRLFLNTRWRLIALDARTGRPVESFGENGEVDVAAATGWTGSPLHYTSTSPPVVWKDLVIVGNGVADRLIYRNDVPGDVQAFDARTGERVWVFHTVPRAGEPGAESWEDGSNAYTGHANVWAPMSLDTARGILYLPVSTPSNDWYGGQRKGDNLYGESVVALDASTGRRLWHYQLVHHGLWDYDPPTAPSLVTLKVKGKRVDALIQPGKTGFLYVFDRVTGKPVWPIEERAVPPSDVPGEKASPTQPFPAWPKPFARQGVTEADLIDFTPELKAMALAEFRKYRAGGVFTPPSLEGTLVLPGNIGGSGWGGAAVDPTTGWLFVKATNSANVFRISKPRPGTYEADYAVDLERGVSAQLPNGLPLTKPPYGTVTAYDMNTGEMKWQVPVGDDPRVRENPALAGVALPPRLGAGGSSGPLATAGGLVFVAGGASKLYALDAKSGKVLWEGDLGERGFANPMTYRTAGGRQVVVVAVGGGENARLVAFGLPQPLRAQR
ncbi:MAG TPA: pyrroloquinoline quinone-dependent dehydrogenase [Longimicrobiales bacterium]|nr:pyrroloquinoline quinone-dependent dehydrogenase [Longimicrobiales bacterium]